LTRDAQVLVIGAGPAGIASAFYLRRAGITYRIVERAYVVAATWADLYPSLRLNTVKWLSHLPEQPMPRHYWIFPTGRQYHRYIQRYVQAHNFPIELGVTVERVTQDGDGWRVTLCDANGTHTTWFRCVILATGRYSNPYTPDILGLAQFGGQVLHAHDYRDPAAFAGKRVLVVGSGPSGLDIAPELGSVAQAPVLLAIRTGLILRPRYPLGLPKGAWLMIAARLPKRPGKWLLAWIGARQVRGQAAAGIPTPPEGKMSSAAMARGGELLWAVKAGHVRVVGAPQHFTHEGVVLADGERAALDAVILATGYRPALYGYVHHPLTVGKDYWPLRDPAKDSNDVTNREVQNAPGLYLVGVFYQGKGALYNCNTEAQEAVRQITVRLAAREQS
jgi:hypothetical protein